MWPWIVAGVVLLMLASGSSAWGYVRGQRVHLELAQVAPGHRMRSDAAAAFRAMRAAATDAGVLLEVVSAFRSMGEQERLHTAFVRGTGNLAAEPGWSNHQGGIAVDIAVGSSTLSSQSLWLAAHAATFRFVRTVASEPWHWEYRP